MSRTISSTSTVTGVSSKVVVLRSQPVLSKKSVGFDESAVDNEGMGKRKSKKCCIYHKPRKFDESSSDEDDVSSSDESGKRADGAGPCGSDPRIREGDSGKGHSHDHPHNRHGGSDELRPSTCVHCAAVASQVSVEDAAAAAATAAAFVDAGNATI